MASKRDRQLKEEAAQDEAEQEALENLANVTEAAGEESKGVAEETAELYKYKVAVAAQEIDGVMHQVGDELSLSHERAEQLKTAGYHLDEA
jgi:hypothetical protein